MRQILFAAAGSVDYILVVLARNVGRARDRGQVSTAVNGGHAAALSLQRSDDGCHMYRLQAAVRHRKA